MTGTSTTRPSSTSPDTAATAQLAPGVAKVLAALHRVGEATAAGTAAEAGLGYSTTTPKLRTLEDQGLAEHIRGRDGRTLWRVTDKGRTYPDLKQAGDAGPDETASSAAEPTGGAGPSATRRRLGRNAHTGGGARRGYGGWRPRRRTAGSDYRRRPPPGAPDPVPADGDDPQPYTPDDSPGDTFGAQSAAEAETAAGFAAEAFESEDQAADAASAVAAAPAEPTAPAGGRRASDTLGGAILDILEANPGQRYKVSELCRLINTASEGTGAKKAGGGAVVNAANQLVSTGHAVLAVEKPATFALARTDADSTAS